MDDTISGSADVVVISHPGGQEQKITIAKVLERPLRMGRESDNDVALGDARVSRYHAQIRRAAGGIEIMDVGSANGTFVGGARVPEQAWQAFPPGVLVYLGDTRLRYAPSAESATTLAATPLAAPESAALPPQPAPAPSRIPAAAIWLLIAGAVIGLAALILVLITWSRAGQVAQAPIAAPTLPLPGTPGQPPAAGPVKTEEVPAIPYPVVSAESVSAQPIILGALPDPTQAFLVVRVRVENQGTGDLTLSPNQFELFDISGLVLKEIGDSYSDDGLRKLGLSDRYRDLRLGPGDNAPESLLFSGQSQRYQLFLRYQPPGLQPIVVDLGTLDAAQEVASALGTPVIPTLEATAIAAATPTTEAQATPSATRPPDMPAPKLVSKSELVGTIAYPVFSGTTFDLYLARVDGSGRRRLLTAASQPQFSPDGSRIAYHSWQKDKRGLITVDVGGGNEHIVGGNLEDQLPTWAPDGARIIFLSRRSGQRASELFIVPSVGGAVQIIGNGEYPTWGADGKLAFKGWMSTGVGLQLANSDLTDLRPLTDNDADTAPAVSPDGKWVAFMSRRDGNWNIYLVRSDGSGLEQLTDDPAEDGLPTWSPDGNLVAFVSNRGGPWSIWAVVPESGASRQLFTTEGPPDGFVAGEDLDKSRGWAEERISWTR